MGPLIFILTIICVSIVLVKTMLVLTTVHGLTAKKNDCVYDKDVSLSGVEYADDCTGVCVTSTEHQLKVALEVLAQEFKTYFEAHGLKINVSKSEHIILGQPRSGPMQVEGRDEATKVKLLGLTFNRSYKFDDHVQNVKNKIASRLGQVTKITAVAPPKVAKELANSLILLVASYASEIYAAESTLINRVQVSINNVMRIITKKGRRTPINLMLTQLKWMTFENMVRYNCVMLMYKIVLTYCTPFSKVLIYRGIDQHQTRYEIRERELRIAWVPRYVRVGGKSYLVRATQAYNHVKLFGKLIHKDDLKKMVKEKIITFKP